MFKSLLDRLIEPKGAASDETTPKAAAPQKDKATKTKAPKAPAAKRKVVTKSTRNKSTNASGPVAMAKSISRARSAAKNPGALPGRSGTRSKAVATKDLPKTKAQTAAPVRGGSADFAAAKPSLMMQEAVTQADRNLVHAKVELAKQFMKNFRIDEAVEMLQNAKEEGPASRELYRLLGEGLFVQEKWEDSLICWFKAAALTQRGDAKMQRRIKMKIMRCNAQLSLIALHKKDKIEAAECLTRAIEAIDYSVYVKARADMVEAITSYMMDEISKDYPTSVPRDKKPKRIAICLDVIKISAVHTHKNLYLSLAAAIAALDPDVTIDIIATYERQLTWNGGFEDYYRPDNKVVLEAFIEEMVPEGIRERINVHYFESFGLRGVIDTCRKILDMKHDLIMYGSGKHGYHGNESLLVRHTLYKYTPTAFFFVQSNNEVDALNDIIIARGQHPIEGEPGTAQVAYQAYPPFPGLQAAVVPEGMDNLEKKPAKVIVTAWVGVRLDKTLNGYKGVEMNKILDILDEVPDAEWHLVGADNPAGLVPKNNRFHRYHAQGRIVIHPVLSYNEFYRITSTASLFFQPPGFTGGGGGASIARNNLVPILCYRHSDVAPLQPPEYVFEEDDLQSGVDAAIAILSSDKARDDLVAIQTGLMESRRSSAPKLFYDCLVKAVETYNKRITIAAETADVTTLNVTNPPSVAQLPVEKEPRKQKIGAIDGPPKITIKSKP